MRYARVGDAVWYRIGGVQEKAEILALEGLAQAVVLLLTGPKRGQTPNAPRGTIEPVKIREIYREYEIEVRVRVDKGLFTDRGFIRKSNPAGTGLPFETSFESGERHASAEEALQAGAAFATRKIDEMPRTSQT